MNLTSFNISSEHFGKLNQLMANLAILILLPMCFYLLASVFWQMYYPDPLYSLSPPVASTKPNPRVDKVTQASWDWFTIYQRKKKKVVVSKINATLVGVMGIGDNGVAMIKLKGEPVKVFRIGDVIQEGVSLMRLGLDHVILLHGEKEEELRIKKTNLFASAAEKEVEKSEEKQRQIEEVRDFARIIKKQPVRLLDIVQFEQVRVKTYGLGYKIGPRNKESESMFNNAGFRKGDVIFVINNQPVVQLAANPSAIGKLLSEDNLTVRLLRRGEIQDVTIALN